MPTGHYLHRSRSLTDRFWGYVIPNNDCWRWTGPRTTREYGNLELPGLRAAGLPRRIVPATHVAWFIATGSWPMHQINHTCDHHWCVQPGHLYDGTQVENMDDLSRAGHPTRKLTDADARAIRALIAAGVLQREAAALYGVGQSTISKVVNGERYRHS